MSWFSDLINWWTQKPMPPKPIPKPPDPLGIEAAVCSYLNKVRARYGLKPVSLDPRLNSPAQILARGLRNETMTVHQDWIKRLNAAGFPTYVAGKQNISEANAMGSPTPEDCIELLNSEENQDGSLGGHTKDIRSPYWLLIGVAYASGGKWGHYWVIEYAHSAAVGSAMEATIADAKEIAALEFNDPAEFGPAFQGKPIM